MPKLSCLSVSKASCALPTCHRLSANTHTEALIYTFHIPSRPRCTADSCSLFLQPWAQLSSSFLDAVYVQPVSINLCLAVSTASCPFIFSLFPILLFSYLLIGCVCLNSLSALSLKYHPHPDLSPAAKSSHPSGTYCAYVLCQPSPVYFRNHFLFNFFFYIFTHTHTHMHTHASNAKTSCFFVAAQSFFFKEHHVFPV